MDMKNNMVVARDLRHIRRGLRNSNGKVKLRSILWQGHVCPVYIGVHLYRFSDADYRELIRSSRGNELLYSRNEPVEFSRVIRTNKDVDSFHFYVVFLLR